MRILGVSLTNTHAALVVIETRDRALDLVDTHGTRKIDLGDHEDAQALQGFSSTMRTFINSYAINQVAVRRCTYKGKQRSGAGAIKMEALLLLVPQNVCLIPPQTVAARFKRSALSHPGELTRYQRDAFETAVAATLQ